jgi:hypothetical protein
MGWRDKENYLPGDVWERMAVESALGYGFRRSLVCLSIIMPGIAPSQVVIALVVAPHRAGVLWLVEGATVGNCVTAEIDEIGLRNH